MIAIFFCFTITTHEMFSHESMNFPSKCNRWHGNRFSILPFILFVPKNRQANQIVFIRQKSLFKIKFELHIRCEYSICCFFFQSPSFGSSIQMPRFITVHRGFVWRTPTTAAQHLKKKRVEKIKEPPEH